MDVQKLFVTRHVCKLSDRDQFTCYLFISELLQIVINNPLICHAILYSYKIIVFG